MFSRKKKSAPRDWSVAGGETDEKYGVRKHQNDQGFDGHSLTDRVWLLRDTYSFGIIRNRAPYNNLQIATTTMWAKRGK